VDVVAGEGEVPLGTRGRQATWDALSPAPWSVQFLAYVHISFRNASTPVVPHKRLQTPSNPKISLQHNSHLLLVGQAVNSKHMHNENATQ
jgi:hypothetical protein